jgi:hypothetical protein
MIRLVSAELLKLRKRRGLLWATLALVVAPVIVANAVIAILHAVDPDRYDGAGGIDNFTGALGVISEIGIVAAILVGVTAGAGDLGAGVFRELVVTGRSRLSLFAARIPSGLLFLAPFLAVAFAITAVVTMTVTGPDAAPGVELVARYAGWLLLVYGFAFLLGLGVASVVGSQALSIGVLLAWQFAISPLLLATGKLDALLAGAALDRLEPATSGDPSISLLTAAVVLTAWAALALAAGAWRTVNREA